MTAIVDAKVFKIVM